MTVNEVATTLASSLKSQPLVVGLLLINIVFVGVMFVAIREARVQEHAEFKILLERCLPLRGDT